MFLPVRLRPKPRVHVGPPPPIHHLPGTKEIDTAEAERLREAAKAELHTLRQGDTRGQAHPRTPAAAIAVRLSVAIFAAAGCVDLLGAESARPGDAPIAVAGDDSYLTEEAPLAPPPRKRAADRPGSALQARPPGDAGDGKHRRRFSQLRDRLTQRHGRGNRHGLALARRILLTVARALPGDRLHSDRRQPGRLRHPLRAAPGPRPSPRPNRNPPRSPTDLEVPDRCNDL